MLFIKKLLTSFVIITLLSFVCFSPVGEAQVIPIEKLAKVEKILYGSPLEMPILQRINKVEKTLFNKNQKSSLITRSNNIINYVLNSVDEPSLLFLINTLEWTLTGNITRKPMVVKIANLEQVIYGKTKSGPLKVRIDKLLKMSLPSADLPYEKLSLVADKLIRIKLLGRLSSQNSRVGQKVNFVVVNDIKHKGDLVIPGGTEGVLQVKKITEAGKMGKDGEIKIDFSSLTAIDGSQISVKIDKKSQEENRSRKLALGASVLGTIILGPVGLIAGYFVEGEDKELPAGTELYIQTEETVQLYGLVLQ